MLSSSASNDRSSTRKAPCPQIHTAPSICKGLREKYSVACLLRASNFSFQGKCLYSSWNKLNPLKPPPIFLLKKLSLSYVRKRTDKKPCTAVLRTNVSHTHTKSKGSMKPCKTSKTGTSQSGCVLLGS